MGKDIFACDFEATTKEEDCRVWAYGYMNVDNINQYHIGETITEFMGWALKKPKECYFHNLKYDGSFILYWLLKNNYNLDRNLKPKPKTFNTTISEAGQWYKIEVTLGYENKGKGKQRRLFTTFFCSLKKLPFPIATIARAFKLPILKGEIDYVKERPIGYVPDEKEMAYIKNDIEILARALKIQFEQGLTNITIGTDAMSDFKERHGRKRFATSFPILSEEVDAYLRKSYKGGFTWVNPKEQGKIIEGGLVYDVNSLYPSQMKDCVLPHGLPIYFKGEYVEDEKHPLYICRIKVDFYLKEAHIPTVQIKGSRFLETEYLTHTDGEMEEMTVTSVDLDLMKEHYHILKIEYLDGYKFAGYQGFFTEYVEHWNNSKIEAGRAGNAALRELSKLMLNNLYGKFGKNPDVTPKLPFIEDGEDFLRFKIPRNILGEEEREYDDGVYIPMGAFITAYARLKTISTAQRCFNRIIYCDTDSIHIKGKEVPEAIIDDIHDDELGKWSHECTFEKAKFLRQKTYVEMIKTQMVSANKKFKINRIKTDIKCAGMPERIKRTLSFESFQIGLHRSTGKLVPKQVKGGSILVNTSFTLK